MQKINPLVLESEHFLKLLEIHHDCAKLGIQMVSLGIKDGSIRPELQPEVTFTPLGHDGFERLMGPIGFEERHQNPFGQYEARFYQINAGYAQRTIQAQRPQAVQASLF